MSLFVSSIASGSNGNCYYIGNANEAVLVDAGISCRELEKRFLRLNLCIKKIRAIFVSHEHSDHIRGLSLISQKHQIPVYITDSTRSNGRLALENGLVRTFSTLAPVQVGDLTIEAFTKRHDAADPHSFVISSQHVRIGVFTDIGTPCKELIRFFSTCNAAFLEANYDETMLETGGYPWHLKQRIRGGNGHLSNRQALEVFTRHRADCMSHLFLSHLSKNNNCPKLVEELFTRQAANVQVHIAGRYNETPVFLVDQHTAVTRRPVFISARPKQLAFSF